MISKGERNFGNFFSTRPASFLIIMQNVNMATNGKCNCMLTHIATDRQADRHNIIHDIFTCRNSYKT